MSREDQQLETLLISLGLLDEERAAEIRSMRKRTGRALLDQCRIAHVAQEERLVSEVARELDMKVVDPVEARVHPRVLKLVPPEVAYRWRVMPLARQKDGGVDKLFVATTHPFPEGARMELNQLLPEVELRFMLAAGTRLDQALETSYGAAPRSDTVSSRSPEKKATGPRVGGSLAAVDLERTNKVDRPARPKRAKPTVRSAPPALATSKAARKVKARAAVSGVAAGEPAEPATEVREVSETSRTTVDAPVAQPAGLIAEMDTLIDTDSDEMLVKPTVQPLDPADTPAETSDPPLVSAARELVDDSADSLPPQEATAGAARLTARPNVASAAVIHNSELHVRVVQSPAEQIRDAASDLWDKLKRRWQAAHWLVRVAVAAAAIVVSWALLAAMFSSDDESIEVAARVVEPPSAQAAAPKRRPRVDVLPPADEAPPLPEPAEHVDPRTQEFRPGVIDAPPPEGHAFVAVDGAELRATASDDSEVVVWLRQGQLLLRIGEIEGSILVMVDPSGPAGFVLPEHLTKTLPLDALAERMRFERCDLEQGRSIDDCLYQAKQQRDVCRDDCREFPGTRCKKACLRAFEMCRGSCKREEERQASEPVKKRRRRRR